MVNVEEFAKRLKIIIDYYEISAAVLAEKIDVQRSSISHILSGRNKPSLDFVLKILKVYPEVELYWLLNGVGQFPKSTNEVISAPTLFSEKGEGDKNKGNEKEESPPVIPTTNNNLIERIVIFYKNGSFKNYTP